MMINNKYKFPPVKTSRLIFKFLFVAVSAHLFFALSPIGIQGADGDLDTTFGDGGFVNFRNQGIAIQADGKIIAVGKTDGQCFIARFNTNGDFDTSFGNGDGIAPADFFNELNTAWEVKIQADGKIVIAGGASSNFGLARYNTDGSPDNTFNGNGGVIVDVGGGQAYSLAEQSDGKIVLAGNTISGISGDFALARINGDGTLDNSFGINGRVTTDFFNGYDIAYDLALQIDGRIILSGVKDISGEVKQDFAVARYNNDGSLDGSFGSGGKVTTDFSGVEGASVIVVQNDGRIVVGGNLGLVRYQSDGSLDNSFGTNGRVITDFPDSDDGVSDIAIQTDGKIITLLGSINGSIFFSGIARYNTNGNLDTSFGNNGRVSTSDGTIFGSLEIQSDGKIVAGGFGGIARYIVLRPTAASVEIGGKVMTANGKGISKAVVSLTDSNGEIRYTLTNSFGFYRLENVSVGETYIFTVSRKGYTFAPQIHSVGEDEFNLNFIANPQSFFDNLQNL